MAYLYSLSGDGKTDPAAGRPSQGLSHPAMMAASTRPAESHTAHTAHHEEETRPLLNRRQPTNFSRQPEVSVAEPSASLESLSAHGSSPAISSIADGSVRSSRWPFSLTTLNSIFHFDKPATGTVDSASRQTHRAPRLNLQPQEPGTGRRRSRSRAPSVVLTPAEPMLAEQTLHEQQDEVWEQDEDSSQPSNDGILPTSEFRVQDSVLTDMDLDIFPSTMKCTVRLNFEHRSETIPANFKGSLPWYEKDAYTEFFAWMKKKLQEMRRRFREPCDAYKIYSRQGVFRITHSADEDGMNVQHSSPFIVIDESSKMREEIVKTVCKFIHDHAFQHEHAKLEIHWDFSTIRLGSEPGITFRRILWMEVQRKMKKKNFNNQSYIPRSDLAQFLLSDVIQKSLDSDEEFNKWLRKRTEDEQRRLINFIKKDATRLHLICVSIPLPFDTLQHWLDGGLTDLDHKNSLGPHKCEMSDYCNSCFDKFREEKGKFFPYTWQAKGQPRNYIEHDENVVLPILYNEKEDLLGQQSASGEVYKVQIDPDHHCFEGDRYCRFALKKFRRRANVEAAFKKEWKVLEQLSKQQNKHVVTHLSCWSQNNDYFILYPLAEMNLAELMWTQQPENSRLNMFWFLRCIKGLTDALRFIHMFSVPDRGSSLDPGVEDTRKNIYTFHHDLKPENILCYVDRSSGDGCTLKIADFGASMIDFLGSSGKSRSHSDPVGTPTYQGPERKRSRPSDLWSLGCVLLEFTMWFTTPNFRRGNFSSDRIRENPKLDEVELDTFWCVKDNQEQLSPAVVQELERLESRNFPFPDLATVIRRLLRIHPKDRILASELDVQVDQILTKHGPPNELQAPTKVVDVDARSVLSAPSTPPSDSPVESRSDSLGRHQTLETESSKAKLPRSRAGGEQRGLVVGAGTSDLTRDFREVSSRPPKNFQR